MRRKLNAKGVPKSCIELQLLLVTLSVLKTLQGKIG